MLFLIIVLLTVLIFFWRLRFLIEYEQKQLSIYWLLPLFGSVRLKHFTLSSTERKKDSKKKKRDLRYYLRLLKVILRFNIISQLDFLLVPGYAHVKCIIAVRPGDIIHSCLLVLRAEKRAEKRSRHRKGGPILWKDRIWKT